MSSTGPAAKPLRTCYYLHIRLAPSLRAKVKSYSKEFRRPGSGLIPHLTILRPFCLRKGYYLDDVCRKILSVAQINDSFQAETDRVASFGTHDSQFGIVHFAIAYNPGLYALHNGLKREIGPITRFLPPLFPNFVPHITLAADLSEREGALLFVKANAEFSADRFSCKKIYLMAKKEGEKKWETLSEFPF